MGPTMGSVLRSARTEIRTLFAQVRGTQTPASPADIPDGHTSVRSALLYIEAALPLADAFEAQPRRGDVALAEATRDPIFLFERRRWRLLHESLPAGFSWSNDLERVVCDGGFGRKRESWTLVEFAKDFSDYVLETWLPEGVWFTREEAEEYGRSHAYRFSQGWRVYCICADGDLARLLKSRSTKPTGVLDPEGDKP